MIRPGDIFVANCDLDEILTRTTLARIKFCATNDYTFFTFGFQFHLNCLAERRIAHMLTTVFPWSTDSKGANIYRRRAHKRSVPINVADARREFLSREGFIAWHLSTFGSEEQQLFKKMHSPHRFVEVPTIEVVRSEANRCEFNNVTRFKIALYEDMLPLLIRSNTCRFRQMGWIRKLHNLPSKGSIIA
jgi:hypothetical protein